MLTETLLIQDILSWFSAGLYFKSVIWQCQIVYFNFDLSKFYKIFIFCTYAKQMRI